MKEFYINYDLYHKKCDSIDMWVDYLRLTYNGAYNDFHIYNYLVCRDSEWYVWELNLDSDNYDNYSWTETADSISLLIEI